MNEEEAKSILKNMDIGISGNAECKECIFDDETRCFRDGKDCQMIAIEIVLNLIQTQQAEIEQLKNKNKHQSKEMQKAVDYTFELNKEIEKKDNKLKDIKNHIKAELKMIDKLYNEVGWAGNEQYDGMKAAYKCLLNIYFENEVETEDK